MAVGLTLRGELSANGPAKLVRGDLHASGRPSTEQLDAELEDLENGENSDESREPLLAPPHDKPALMLARFWTDLVVESCSPASVRIREGHGARGPPLT